MWTAEVERYGFVDLLWVLYPWNFITNPPKKGTLSIGKGSSSNHRLLGDMFVFGRGYYSVFWCVAKINFYSFVRDNVQSKDTHQIQSVQKLHDPTLVKRFFVSRISGHIAIIPTKLNDKAFFGGEFPDPQQQGDDHRPHWVPCNVPRMCVCLKIESFADPTWMSQEVSKWFVNGL